MNNEKTTKHEQHLKKRPSVMMALMPLAVLVTMLTLTIRAFGSDSLEGASQITLLIVSAFCVLVGMAYLNVPWSSFEKAITKNVSSVSSALIILLLIGALGVPLFSHIRYMLITTVPSIVLTLIIFTVAGFFCQGSQSTDVAAFTGALQQRFSITPWLLLVPFFTGVLIARRVPPVITLFLSTVMAVGFAIVFQADALHEIDPSLFRAAMKSAYGSTSLATSSPMLTDLVATRGMSGMMGTIWLIICAMCFGGCMSAGGMVSAISRLFIHMVKGRTSLVGATAATGVMLNVAIADQYLCILLTGNMFRDVYDREGYERRLLSRTTEDAVTVTSVLVPWNTCGMTQSTVLGVSAFTYLPYCFFNIISPLMSVAVAALGYKIFRKETAEAEVTAVKAAAVPA